MFPRFRSKPEICIILTQNETVFGSTGKHSVGFRCAFGYEVIDQNAYIGIGPTKGEGRLAEYLEGGVGAATSPWAAASS